MLCRKKIEKIGKRNLMNYCPHCKKLVLAKIERIEWNSMFFMFVVHCEVCNNFLYQHLQKKSNESE